MKLEIFSKNYGLFYIRLTSLVFGKNYGLFLQGKSTVFFIGFLLKSSVFFLHLLKIKSTVFFTFTKKDGLFLHFAKNYGNFDEKLRYIY